MNANEREGRHSPDAAKRNPGAGGCAPGAACRLHPGHLDAARGNVRKPTLSASLRDDLGAPA